MAVVTSPPPLVFRMHEGAPELVREVLLERGWEEYDRQKQEDGDWNLYWRASAFHSSDYDKLLPWQRLNHHPKTTGITRKDCLARNLKRMRGTLGSTLYDFSPTAFILPNDFTRFLAEYTKQRLEGGGVGGRTKTYWICKPVDMSRGRGIFIFEDIKDLVYDSSVIVQRYVSNPFLISGYKFDLRIYVCVKSFKPLTIYIHQEGLVRFATEKYDLSSLDNLYSHLTNTSINKFGPFYTTDKERVGQGCKWTMSKFRCFLQSQEVDELLLWLRINSIVTLTLLTIAASVPACTNCVELFGFDILIDDHLKPWLLEVNFSPALSLDCQADLTVKKELINDMIDLMDYQLEDGLRPRGCYRQKYRRPCYLGSQSQGTPELLLPRSVCQRQSEKRSYSQSSLQAGLAEQRGYLPSVQPNQTRSCVNGTASLNPTLQIHTNHLAALSGNRRTLPAASLSSVAIEQQVATHLSDVTDAPEDTYTSTPDSACRQVALPKSRDTPPSSSSSASYRLPAILSQRQPSVRRLWVNRRQDRGTALPPPPPPLRRVGDFILTFPFNQATLSTSQEGPGVRLAVQELSKLTNQLAARCGQVEKRKRREKKVSEHGGHGGKEDFESLLWGPKNPPLLSECCYSK